MAVMLALAAPAGVDDTNRNSDSGRHLSLVFFSLVLRFAWMS